MLWACIAAQISDSLNQQNIPFVSAKMYSSARNRSSGVLLLEISILASSKTRAIKKPPLKCMCYILNIRMQQELPIQQLTTVQISELQSCDMPLQYVLLDHHIMVRGDCLWQLQLIKYRILAYLLKYYLQNKVCIKKTSLTQRHAKGAWLFVSNTCKCLSARTTDFFCHADAFQSLVSKV